FQQRLRLPAAVGLHDADDDVVAVLSPGAGLLPHLIGLADARRRTHEDSELADGRFLAPGRLEQGLRRGPLIIAPWICHLNSSLLCDSGPTSSVRSLSPLGERVGVR